MKNLSKTIGRYGICLLLLLGALGTIQAQTSVCEGEAVILTLSGYSGQIQWETAGSASGPFVPMSGVTGDSASIFPDSSAFYRAEVINGTCDPFYSDTLEITVLPAPTADAGMDLSLCEGEQDSLGGNPAASGGTMPYTYSWSPSTGLSATNIAHPVASPTISTTYTLTVADTNGCADADDVVVTVIQAPLVSAGPDTSINCGDSLQLQSAVSGPNGPFNIAWSPAATLSDSTVTSPMATPFGDTDYVLTVTDSFGCSATDTASIIVIGATTGVDTFMYSGTIETFTVPSCSGPLTISVWGAAGGNSGASAISPGLGAYQQGTFTLAPGTQLKVLVGQNNNAGNGGGGGSFVTLMNNTPLIIAGGGGGGSQTTDSNDKHGQAGTTGGTGAAGGGVGGSNGNGGSVGASGFQSGAGGGLLTDGADGWTANSGGDAFVNGGAGANVGYGIGGFGGGGNGSGNVVGGGGGGYSGGGGGGNTTGGVGGGGGSYNSGTNPTSTAGVNSGDGMIIISW